jgi:hypothetical protein
MRCDEKWKRVWSCEAWQLRVVLKQRADVFAGLQVCKYDSVTPIS